MLSWCFTTILPPLFLALILRPLSFNNFNYLPAGPTPLIFAMLAQYHAAIPHIYKYRIAASAASAYDGSLRGPYLLRQIIHISPRSAIGTRPVPRIFALCGCWLDSRLQLAKRCAAGRNDEMESPGMAGGNEGPETS